MICSGICPVKWQWRDSNSQPPTTISEARALTTAPPRLDIMIIERSWCVEMSFSISMISNNVFFRVRGRSVPVSWARIMTAPNRHSENKTFVQRHKFCPAKCFSFGPTKGITPVQQCVVSLAQQADGRRCINVGLPLVHRLRRWTDGKPIWFNVLCMLGHQRWAVLADAIYLCLSENNKR